MAECPVYLRLPWLGSVSTRFEKQVKSTVKQCFSAVEPRVVYSTNELLPATNKDVLPALQKSNVIYQFSCHCDSRYVGRTSQRLQNRIKQQVPKSIRCCSSSQKRLLPARRCKSSTQTNTQFLASDSAIGLHLLQNPTFAQYYDDSRFSIIAQRRSPFHLSSLGATFIKTSNPALSRQTALSILTILLDKCQTKRFEDMNILIKAILKFCTTNQLFKRKLVRCLLSRAYKICNTWPNIHSEFETITNLLLKNGYPLSFIQNQIRKFLNNKHN